MPLHPNFRQTKTNGPNPARKKMERDSEEINGSANPFHQYGPDFGLIDFVDEPYHLDFQPVLNPNVVNGVYQGFHYQDSDNMGHVYDDNVVDRHFFQAAEMFDFGVAPTTGHVAGYSDHNSNVNMNMGDLGLMNAFQNQVGDEDDSSGSATMVAAPEKSDRSRTLISERKRRSRMKEKLYALRALVPNITKMDKASIVGDAVSYVQDLQMQAKKLKAEIGSLESEGDKYGDKTAQFLTSTMGLYDPIIKKIFKIDVNEVEERGFYVNVVSNKGKGVAASLYKALESFTTTFNIHNSNLTASSSHNYLFTFTLHTMDGQMAMSLENMKMWIVSVFLNQGFEFQTSSSS